MTTPTSSAPAPAPLRLGVILKCSNLECEGCSCVETEIPREPKTGFWLRVSIAVRRMTELVEIAGLVGNHAATSVFELEGSTRLLSKAELATLINENRVE